jgi:hypothetical protein
MTPLLLVLFLFQQEPSLDLVIGRASEYVARYEEELGNLIGTEEYVQNAVWLAGSPARVTKRAQRRTSSDFLIIQFGAEWAALRKVNRLDGQRVKEIVPSFEDAFDESPQANARRLRDMKLESIEHNLGDVRREINLPTFALKILRKTETARFAFERAGNARVGGVATWRIRFREVAGPSLVSGANGEALFSTGMLWIEPETGRVLQTEMEVENPHTTEKLTGRILVTYGMAKNVDILTPSTMVERYESLHHTVDCRADYSNFRPFQVDVKFEISAPQP